MNRILAVAAALLLIQPIEMGVATAAENPEHLTKDAGVSLKQKKSEKILIMLKALGISDPSLTEFVNNVEGRTKNGYLTLHQEDDVLGGTLSFRYEMKAKIGTKQIELHYAPKDSNFEYKARTNSVMMNYKLRF